MKPIVTTIVLLVSSLSTHLHAGGVDDLINHYMIQATSETASFAGFVSDRGKDLYLKELLERR